MAQLEPVLTLTIPSVHDWTVLDCRIFHPASLTDQDIDGDDGVNWKGQAAVFAHPYAPFGGSYDDGVVETVVRELVKLGYVVATFNFRGAGNSAGKTSWTARPERGDYTSVVGFLIHYAHGLGRALEGDEHWKEQRGDDSTAPHGVAIGSTIEGEGPRLCGQDDAHIWNPILLMGGYSYGALVTAQLPPLATLVSLFEAPVAGSAAAEIRLRAERLSAQQGAIQMRRNGWAKQRRQRHRLSAGWRVGGDERRVSEDLKRKGLGELFVRTRSGARMMRGLQPVERVRPTSAPGRVRRMPWSPGLAAASSSSCELEETPDVPAVRDMLLPRAAYVLISPLQGLVTQLATMSFFSPLRLRQQQHHHDEHHGHGEHHGHDEHHGQNEQHEHNHHQQHEHGENHEHSKHRDLHYTTYRNGRRHRRLEEAQEAEDKFARDATLAIFGGKDGLVPVDKVRAWAGKLQARGAVKLEAREVCNAGHFWAERGVLGEMRARVGNFAETLLEEEA